MNIGEKIQICRKKQKMSQEELGALLMVSRQTISLWENGQTVPTVDNLLRLKEIFGVSLDSILDEGTGENEGKSEPDESYSFEFTVDELVDFQKRLTLKSRLKSCQTIAIFTAMLVLSLICLQENFVTGMMLACLLLTIGVRRAVKKEQKKAIARISSVSDNSYRYKLYTDYLMFEQYRDGELRQTVKIYYSEIEGLYDIGNITAISYKNLLYPFKTEYLPENSIVFSLKDINRTTSPKALAEDRNTTVSLWLTLFAALSLFIPATIVDTFVENGAQFFDVSFIMFFFTPIPAALAIYGIIQKTKKRAGVMNIIIGFAVFAILIIYGTFSFIF